MSTPLFETVCWLDRGWQNRPAGQDSPLAERVVVGAFESKDEAMQAGKAAFRIGPDYIAFSIRQRDAVEATA